MSASSPRNPPRRDPRERLIHELQRQLGRAGAAAEEWATPAADVEIFSSGAAALDRLLPGGGLRHGMLVEWLAESAANGAVTLSLLAAREACRQGGVLVVIDGQKTFYPPAAAAWGIDLARLIVVRPQTARDALWAAIQSLRSPAVAAVWTAVDRLDSRAFRCLQLAAGAGHTLGLLVRPESVRGQPSWADVQVAVGGTSLSLRRRAWSTRKRVATPIAGGSGRATRTHRRIQIHVLRSRGARPGGRATLEIDDATHTVREVEEGYRLSAVGYQPSLLADSR